MNLSEAPRRPLQPPPSRSLVSRAQPRPLVRADRRLARLAVRHDGPAAVQPGAAPGDRRAARAGRDAGDDRRVLRLRHDDLHHRLGHRRRVLRDPRRPDRPRQDDGLHDPALLAVHRAERVLGRGLGLLLLPVPDRPGRRRAVRGRRGAGGRVAAGPGPAVCARLAAGVLGRRQHDGGDGRHHPRPDADGRLHRQRVAGDVPGRLAPGAPLHRRVQEAEGAGALAARGQGRCEARVVWRALLGPALALQRHRRHAAGVRRRRRPLGHRLLQLRSVPLGAGALEHAAGRGDVLDRHDVAAAERRRLLRHLRVHAPDAAHRPQEGVRDRVRRGDALDRLHLLEPERPSATSSG